MKRSKTTIAVMLCIALVCSTLFSSAAVFAESGDGYPTDKIEKYMDSKAVTINTSNGEYHPGDSLDPKGSFDFSIAFSERDNGRQFPSDGKMYYKIPEVITISSAITNEDILEEGSKDKVIGTYSISRDGTISVNLDKDYIEKYDNVRVYVSFRGSFEKKFTEGDGDKYIEFADGVKVQVDFKKVVNLKISKEHSKVFDYEKNELIYTVNVKTDNDTTDVVVTDTPSNNLIFKKGTLKVQDNKTKKDVSDFEIIKDDADGWQIKFAAMSKDADYNITYTAKLSDAAVNKINNSMDNGVGVAVNNKVTCTAKDADQKETTDNHTISAFQKLQKAVTEDKANNKLTWKVTVNAKKFFDVSGYKVVDTLPNGLTLKTGSVKVEKDGKATDEAQVKETAKGWEYQIPAEPKNNRSTYTFTYDTNLPVNDTVKDVTYKNRIQLIWSGKTMTVDKGYTAGRDIQTSLEKYLVGPKLNGAGTYNQAIEMDKDGNRYIHYGVKIEVPAGGIPNAVLRDVVRENSSHQLNKGLNHELYNGLKAATREEIKDKPVEEKFQYITIVNYDPKKLVVDQTELGTGGFKAYFGDKNNSVIPDKGGKKYQIYLQYYTKITGTQLDLPAWNYMYLDLAGGNSVSDWEKTNIQTNLSGKKDGVYDPKTKTITWKVLIDTATNKAGLGADPIFVEDQFSDNQTYVEGSAMLNNTKLAADKVTGKDGKYKFDLGVCKSLLQYTLTYKTKVKDDVFDKGDVVYFKNKAVVKNDSKTLLDIPEKVLTESNKTVGKQMTQKPVKDNAYTAKYTLTVNPNKGILAGAGSEYIIEDQYSEHLRIDTDSIKIKKDDTDFLTEDQYTISGGINNEPLKITIPDADGHKFVITYDAIAFGNVGATIELKNTATFKAGTKCDSSESKGEVTFEEQHSSAGGIGSKSAFTVMKCDNADINKVLAGAEFELYKESVSSANYLGSATTGQDGKAEFSKANLNFNNKPYNPESGVKYILVEKNAPEGYEKGDNTEFQILGDNPQLDDVTLYQMKDTIKVPNQKYNFYIKKVAEESGSALSGAEFSLFNDKECKTDAVQTVKEDKDNKGHFTFKGLTPKTYYMKETKVPTGYYDSKTIYTVVIDKDGNAAIDGKAVNAEDRTYTITNTKAGSISVTKEVKENGIGIADSKTYYTALFSDSDLTKRVSEVKELKMNGNQSTSITFKELKLNETYYVAETDQDGKAYPNEENKIGSVISYENQKVFLDPSNLKAESKITNSYYTDYYWSGSIKVTKHVTMGGEKAETNKVFYVGLYNDKDFTDRVGKIQKLDMGGKASTTATFSKLSIDKTYYVAETDKEGNVITDAEGQLGCEMTIDNNKITLTKEKTEGTAEITNAFPDQYNFYIQKTSAHTGEALAGAEFTLFNDKDCKDRIVKVTGDKNGKFAFKNLQKGTYYLKETKVPDGYYDSKKVYEVKIDNDGIATIDGEAVKADDKTYTITNTKAGSITVTKEVKENGIGIADSKTYYTALFSDSDLTKRVSEIKELKMNGNQSTSVTFEELKLNETYYVAETDQDGKAYPNEENKIGSVISYENQKVSLDPSNLKAESKITNSYYTDYYWSGSIKVTKHVTMGGEKAETNKVFYVGLYNDKDFTDRVGKIQKLDMGGKASTTVTFSKLSIDNTYYVAETDKEGNVITDAEGQLGCEMTIDNNKITLTKEKTEGTAEITNAFPDQYNFYIQKTSAHTGEALAGAEFTLFNDKDCKDKIVKVTGDKNGKFAFKNLQKGTYYLKETKVPDGYYDSKKVYEVKIDNDGIATIDGEAVKAGDKTYTITNTLTGSIKVTKEAKEDGLDTDVYKMTYHTALFSDKGLTKRVSDVKTLEMDGIHSTSVTFDGLEVGKIYYVAETDQDGKALPRQNDGGKWLVDYENQEVKLDPSNLNAESKITNSYYSNFYWSGSIDVTKLVTKGGDKAESNKVFYVGLYNDKDFTDRVGEIQALKMEGKASTTVTFSDLPLNHTYYVAETDKDGTVITEEKAEQQGYKITIDQQKVSLTKENQIGSAKITNAFDDEYNFYIQKTSAHTKDALTGAEFTLFKDSNCTDKKVTVKGDDNGKFAFKNLNEGTYFLKETKVPDGYYDSEKVYTVVIDADGTATIDGDAVNAEDKTYTVTNTLAGRIKVTKNVKEDGIGIEDFRTYYTALFSDSDFQNRVTEVKALEMKGSQSTSVSFDNLKANETYYVAETDADGTAFPNEGNEIDATITYDNQAVTLDPNNLSAESKITNSFTSGYYWAGSIDVTKRVTVGGNEAETNNIFYVGLYMDQACTEQVGDIQPLVMDGNAETTVTFSDLPLGHTYYVAETDSKGKVITDSKEQLGCEMTIDNRKISLTKENQTGSAEIINDFPDEEQFYYDGEITVKKTTTHNGEAYNTDDVFYAALFADKAHTKRITDVKALDMDGGSKAEVSFENLPYGAYYLAETDQDGKALSDIEAAKLGYTNLLDEVIQLDENPVDIELENQMTKEYVKAVQTGDESNMALAVLGMLAALTAMAILVISRKRKNS